MERRWSKGVRWGLILITPLLLLIIDLRMVNGPWFVRWEYGKAGFPPDPFGMSTETRVRLATVCVDYLASGADIALLADLRLRDGEPAFNQRELQHMADVQAVYRAMIVVGGGLAVLWGMGMGSLLAMAPTRRQAANGLLGGAGLTLAILLILGVVMVLSWQTFFTAFHRIFFAEGTWVFAYSDTLIRLFPERFWIDVAATVVGLLIAESIVLGGLGYFLRRAWRSLGREAWRQG